MINTGGVEIRTLERSCVAGFQGRCLQPLGHSSAMSQNYKQSRFALQRTSLANKHPLLKIISLIVSLTFLKFLKG